MAGNQGTFAGLALMGAEDVPNDCGKWILHGQQGSGKSTLAATIAQLGKTLYVDLLGEKGIRSFQGAPWAGNIVVVRPTSITQLTDIYDALARGEGGFKCVVVDSLTSVQKMAMRFMLGHSETAAREIQKGTAPADQRTWGQTLDIMTDFATFWFDLADATRPNPLQVVLTSQTKLLEDEIAGEVTNRTLDVQKGALQITRASADYILYCEAEANTDAEPDDDGNFPTRYLARFGYHPGYSTKARVPMTLRGKMPAVIGRAPVDKNDPSKGSKSPDLAQLSRILGIGGVPGLTAKRPEAAAA
jgi:energy-coupling factor transporter ATP-binding protein EcfA2